jgi:hypothetical protein
MTESFIYDQEMKGGNGETLMKTSRGFEKTRWGSIDEDGKEGTLDTSHHPVDIF